MTNTALSNNFNDDHSASRVEAALDKPISSLFYSNWQKAISIMGTELKHLDDVQIKLTEFNWEGRNFPMISLLNAEYPDRDHKMSSAAKYQAKKIASSYEHRLELDRCALCRRTVAAVDDLDAKKEDRVFIHDEREGFVFPNRFPVMLGHSLWVPKDHDLPRITYAKSLNKGELGEIFQIADKFNLVAMRNHPHDGMTIPQHDHFHLLPAAELKAAEHLVRMSINWDKSYWSNSLSSPFATLVIRPEAVLDRVVLILQNLERAKIVYTLCYYEGNLFVTPRRSSIVGQKVKIGGGIGFHVFDQSGAILNNNIKAYLPRVGEFNWNKFLPDN